MTFVKPTNTDPTLEEVVVDSTAGGTQILAQNSQRRGVVIVNGSGAAISIGPTGLTFGTTAVLAPGQAVTLDGYIATLYAITSAGSSSVKIFTW